MTAAPFQQSLIAPLTYQSAPNDETGQPELQVGGVSLSSLIDVYGSPLYVLDAKTIRSAAQAYVSSLKEHYPGDSAVMYACKANLNRGLAKLLASEGVGFDVVSQGELTTVTSVGIDGSQILMNGNNKSKAELKAALTEGVHRIVVDNFDELDRLEAVATELETDVSVFIRVAPGIECHTHDYIKTGQNDSKFGFGLWDVPKALERLVAKQDDSTSRVTLVGLQAHIGSQIFELQAYQDLARTMLNMLYNIRKEYGVTLTELDLGGGLGIAYTHQDDPQPTTLMLSKLCQELVAYSQELDFPLPKLLVEPGRSLMACAGMTLYQVGGRKEVPDGPIFISVDGGMGDNIRPALYQAEYSAVVINKFDQEPTETVRLVGKYCESGDILLRAFKTPRLEPGDQVVLFGTGAYNEAMASTYNRIPRPAAVLVEDGQSALLVRRETTDDLLLRDQLPTWL